MGLRRGFSESLRVSSGGLGSVCCVAGDRPALAFEGARAAAFRGAFLGKAYGSLELDSYIPYEVTRRGIAGLASLGSGRGLDWVCCSEIWSARWVVPNEPFGGCIPAGEFSLS